ncbi:MAG: hypothetical protein M3Y28_03300 [Armatimonadota bacterium]|nr:hypothetical protein [Armatimonadota bacterium]
MSWKPLAYALLCVVAPAVWGLLVYWASILIERRVLRKTRVASGQSPDDEETLPLEYYI